MGGILLVHTDLRLVISPPGGGGILLVHIDLQRDGSDKSTIGGILLVHIDLQ